MGSYGVVKEGGGGTSPFTSSTEPQTSLADLNSNFPPASNANLLGFIDGSATPSEDGQYRSNGVSWVKILDDPRDAESLLTGVVNNAQISASSVRQYSTPDDNAKTNKDSVVTVFEANVVLTGEQVNDGVTTLLSDVLLVGQTDPIENGVYVTSAGAWSRRADLATGSDGHGASLLVTEGTVNSGAIFYVDVVQGTAAVVGTNGLTFSRVASGPLPWEIRSSTGADLVDGSRIAIDTSGGIVTINLPASPTAGDTVFVKDYANTWGTNKAVLGRNGENIEGDALNFDLDVKKSMLEFTYLDASRGWVS